LSADIYLGIGANLGDPLATFNQALTHIEAFTELISVSRIYRSAPFGFSDQPPFKNAAVRISSELTPLSLLKKLQEIEKKPWKKNYSRKWAENY
jgi:2-amino-4-hydroxy-6-hydroxymethyldihydropteridine diphosphokinase